MENRGEGPVSLHGSSAQASWRGCPPGMKSSACRRMPSSALHEQQVLGWSPAGWGENKGQSSHIKEFLLCTQARTPKPSCSLVPSAVCHGCMCPRVPRKGHLQPQNGKENKNTLWEHVDGESRQRCEHKRAVTAKADRNLMFPSQSQDARIRGDRSSTVCPCFSFFSLNFAGIWENGC